MSVATPVRRTPSATRGLQEFLHTEAGGSLLLLAATVVALVWANSPAGDAYDELWETVLVVDVGGHAIREDLRHWVNDGLMVFFFYVVGLEIRRELVLGELRDRREAAVPAVAALAGMVVPAALFLAVNPSGEEAKGWGVVMATDIAFALGALALLGRRCPPQVRVFLLTLAIVDDIGAVTVIALFYSKGIDLVALGAAVAILLAIVGVKRLGPTWRGPAYFVAGLGLWVAMHESGVHPTIAGVLLGVLTGVHAPRRADVERAATLTRSFRQAPTSHAGRRALLGIAGALSPNERLQEALHPWTSYVIVPLFALANAGVDLGDGALGDALGSSLALGIVLGLVVGKVLGVTLVTAAAVRAGLGTLPRRVDGSHVRAVGALAGIGFTVSLFVVDLAFDDEALRDQAKVGVLLASVLAAGLAAALLRVARSGDEDATAPRLDPPVDPAHDRIRGPVDAPFTLVAHLDLADPSAAEVARVAAGVRERLGDRVRYVLRHLPDDARHPQARLVHEALEAAAAQGRFWELHDRVLAEPDRLDLDDLVGHAQALGLDVERMLEALDAEVHAAAVEADVAAAEAAGVEYVPTLFAGDRRVEGPVDADALVRALGAT